MNKKVSLALISAECGRCYPLLFQTVGIVPGPDNKGIVLRTRRKKGGWSLLVISSPHLSMIHLSPLIQEHVSHPRCSQRFIWGRTGDAPSEPSERLLVATVTVVTLLRWGNYQLYFHCAQWWELATEAVDELWEGPSLSLSPPILCISSSPSLFGLLPLSSSVMLKIMRAESTYNRMFDATYRSYVILVHSLLQIAVRKASAVLASQRPRRLPKKHKWTKPVSVHVYC